MKRNYAFLIVISILAVLNAQSQDISRYAYRVKGKVPKVVGTQRVSANITSAYLNYIKSDSSNYPLTYFMDYMFYINSRYNKYDIGIDTSNELLLHNFSVMFDTILDANTGMGYVPDVVQSLTVDSLSIIIGESNWSGTRDTIVVQIDSVDTTGYITGTVLHSDTVYTMSSSSAFYESPNPFNLVVKPNYMLNGKMFAVTVSYYGSKFDTLGFLPGFGYTNCISGGSGPVPEQTTIGKTFGSLRANSLTSGYQYFFGTEQTIPSSTGSNYGIYVPCSNPSSKYWYFQDNPIGAYVHFTNVTGIDETNMEGFSISQNYPNPFNNVSEITYSLKRNADVEFYVSDIAGRILMNTGHKQLPPGRHSIKLDASSFGPGMYIYTFNINGSKVSRKMVISQ